jgi:hypothetical protein
MPENTHPGNSASACSVGDERRSGTAGACPRSAVQSTSEGATTHERPASSRNHSWPGWAQLPETTTYCTEGRAARLARPNMTSPLSLPFVVETNDVHALVGKPFAQPVREQFRGGVTARKGRRDDRALKVPHRVGRRRSRVFRLAGCRLRCTGLLRRRRRPLRLVGWRHRSVRRLSGRGGHRMTVRPPRPTSFEVGLDTQPTFIEIA